MLGGAGPGDTFLTDMLMPGASKKGAKRGKATFTTATKPNFRGGSAGNRMTPSKQQHADDEDQSEVMSDLEDEYRDVVFDVNMSRALVKIADDYLDGKEEEPLLALPAPGDDLDLSALNMSGADDTKSLGGASRFTNASGMSKLSNRDFVSINKHAQGKMRPFLRQQRPTDRLAPDQRARLEEMVKEIDDNIEGLLAEKEEYFKGDGQSVSKRSGIPDAPNVYSFEGQTKSRMDEIDSRLRMRNPAAQDNTSVMPSIASL